MHESRLGTRHILVESGAEDDLDSPREDRDDAGSRAYRANTGHVENITNSNFNDVIMALRDE